MHSRIYGLETQALIFTANYSVFLDDCIHKTSSFKVNIFLFFLCPFSNTAVPQVLSLLISSHPFFDLTCFHAKTSNLYISGLDGGLNSNHI